MLKIQNQTATNMVENRTIFNSRSIKFIKIIGKIIIKENRKINDNKPPRKPNPHANPEILPKFFFLLFQEDKSCK